MNSPDDSGKAQTNGDTATKAPLNALRHDVVSCMPYKLLFSNISISFRVIAKLLQYILLDLCNALLLTVVCRIAMKYYLYIREKIYRWDFNENVRNNVLIFYDHLIFLVSIIYDRLDQK